MDCSWLAMASKKEDGRHKNEVAVSAPDTWQTGGANTSWAVTDFVARFDETAKKRLENMNQKLRDLERQMEVLEAEMNKVNDYERMLLETPRPFGS